MGDVDVLCNEVVGSGLLFVLQKQNQPEVYFQENFYFKHKTKQRSFHLLLVLCMPQTHPFVFFSHIFPTSGASSW